MTVYVQPTDGKDFPPLMRGDRMRPDGTFGLTVEGDLRDLFSMGVSQWTPVPDPNATSIPAQVCNRDGAHAAHIYMPNRIWFRCPGVQPGTVTVVKSLERSVQPERPKPIARHVRFVLQRRIPTIATRRHWEDYEDPQQTIAAARERLDETQRVYNQVVEWRIVERTTIDRIAHEETGI
jgi:hypothetical protein